jgi:hypothetical protein
MELGDNEKENEDTKEAEKMTDVKAQFCFSHIEKSI